LPTVVLLFWLSPKKLRPALLLIASYVFYMSWKPIYGALIFGLTLMNYLLGLAIDKSETQKKPLLILAIAGNLLTLGFFKYAYFAQDTLNGIASIWGKSVPSIPWQIILPLGISFFVFEFIHYVTDVYKGGKPIGSFVNFALFASFFPTQIAGPIKRYQDFIPQLSQENKFDMSTFDEGINLILFGLFKKVIFADNLAVVVQSAYAHANVLSSFDLWLATYSFAFQIYFDFSGYTDIARGSAMLFGYKVPLNFNLPYLASSIAEFWHRWHISLSTWLRDYLFIPSGGSRCSRIFNYRNLFITMALGGLWHGASMHFVVWGAYQGIMLIAHKEFVRATKSVSWFQQIAQTKVYHLASIVLTFHVVCVGWVFFRAETMEQALAIIGKLLFIAPTAAPLTAFSLSLPNVSDPVIFLLLPLVLLVLFAGQLLSGYLQAKFPMAREGHLPIPKYLAPVFVAAMICLLMVFTPDTSPRFIYFQF
jgi:D-alanyl-lipoteichoic acid acyltransferase DltB (MBOAT superfamily)